MEEKSTKLAMTFSPMKLGLTYTPEYNDSWHQHTETIFTTQTTQHLTDWLGQKQRLKYLVHYLFPHPSTQKYIYSKKSVIQGGYFYLCPPKIETYM